MSLIFDGRKRIVLNSTKPQFVNVSLISVNKWYLKIGIEEHIYCEQFFSPLLFCYLYYIIINLIGFGVKLIDNTLSCAISMINSVI